MGNLGLIRWFAKYLDIRADFFVCFITPQASLKHHFWNFTVLYLTRNLNLICTVLLNFILIYLQFALRSLNNWKVLHYGLPFAIKISGSFPFFHLHLISSFIVSFHLLPAWIILLCSVMWRDTNNKYIDKPDILHKTNLIFFFFFRESCSVED